MLRNQLFFKLKSFASSGYGGLRSKTPLFSLLTRGLLTLLLLVGFIQKKSYAQNCVGTAGQVQWSYWLNLGNNLDTATVYSLEMYPDFPDGVKTLPKLSTPINYADRFAGLIRGFIKVPTTSTYIFNITGDDNTYFFLSPNANPNQKGIKAYVEGYTNVDQYDKFPSQTSEAITLQANTYYYFEILQLEGTGNDFATLSWHKITEGTWQIVDFNYIYEYTCNSTCPPRGTPCDDGNSLTTDDTEDGFCNCVGVSPTTNSCVGERGLVDAYYFDNIPGSYIEDDLTNSPNFPLIPDRREKLNGAYGPLSINTNNDYGTLVQGYLTVPMTGTYELNITGDNQTFFFLSKNDSIEYKQTHQMVVINNTTINNHSASVLQNSGPLFLEKGKYYYYEFRHKESGYNDFFNLFWKTPFYSHKSWKKVPSFYLFDYNCEVSCIAENTPCNDGNPYTNNDHIDANCNCVGTPCSGPDCQDTEVSYQPYEDCTPTNTLTPAAEAAWETCNTAANPNAVRSSAGHWILYSFDDIYRFNDTRVWNYNVPNLTNKGFKNVVVDYSLDGNTWSSIGGTYTWPQAPGTTDYTGFTGPNLNNVKAKYILISALSNYGNTSCYGFSKITMDAQLCNPKDTPCDDGDPLTFYDKFDDNCNCRGVDINCSADTLALGTNAITDSLFQAKKTIQTQNKIDQYQNISFTAGNSIVLLPGFEVSTEGVFVAEIRDCIQAQFKTFALQPKISGSPSSLVQESNDARIKKVIFRINEPGMVKLVLKNEKDELISTLIEGYQQNLGTQQKNIPTSKLQKGSYTIVLRINDTEVSEVFEVK